jgi:hypothetical protein
MGEQAVFIGYGMIGKSPYANGKKLEKLGFFNSDLYDEDDDLKPICKVSERDGEIGFTTPYESEVDFLGLEVDDDDMFLGLPTISEENKAKVDALYESLPQELKDILIGPDWVFIAHYV